MFRTLAAAQLAFIAHQGQNRKYDGRPYIVHPARVAARVTLLNGPLLLDQHEDMIIAAWLHDVVEDTRFTLKDIKSNFGDRVTRWVDQLTSESKKTNLEQMGVDRNKRKRVDREALERADTEAKIIKILDRTDNLRDMVGAPQDGFKRLYHAESVELFESLRGAPYMDVISPLTWSAMVDEFHKGLVEVLY